MSSPVYHQAQFLLSVAKLSQLPPDEGSEVAFAGRSNAGKSSVINCITQQKRLAKISKTPGRTQLINFFSLSATQRFTDLPGYGYAKVAKSTQQYWQGLLSDYLTKRQCLQGLLLMMDIRHPLSSLDWLLLEFCQSRNLPCHILLTKADKLGYGQQTSTLHAVRHQLIDWPETTVQVFSVPQKLGLAETYAVLDRWLFS